MSVRGGVGQWVGKPVTPHWLSQLSCILSMALGSMLESMAAKSFLHVPKDLLRTFQPVDLWLGYEGVFGCCKLVSGVYGTLIPSSFDRGSLSALLSHLWGFVFGFISLSHIRVPIKR